MEECIKLVDFLKNDPVYGGNAVMLGVPYWWRSLDRDCIGDPRLHELIKEFGVGPARKPQTGVGKPR